MPGRARKPGTAGAKVLAQKSGESDRNGSGTHRKEDAETQLDRRGQSLAVMLIAHGDPAVMAGDRSGQNGHGEDRRRVVAGAPDDSPDGERAHALQATEPHLRLSGVGRLATVVAAAVMIGFVLIVLLLSRRNDEGSQGARTCCSSGPWPPDDLAPHAYQADSGQ